MGKDSNTIADNIVFEGKMVLEKVLSDGLRALGESIDKFNTPIWNELEDLPAEYVNEEGTNA